jgi:hypothetical protein
MPQPPASTTARLLSRRTVLGVAVCLAVGAVAAPEFRAADPGGVTLAWRHEGSPVFDVETGRVLEVSPTLPSGLVIANPATADTVLAGTAGTVRATGGLNLAVSSSQSLGPDAELTLPVDLAPGDSLVIPLLYYAAGRAVPEGAVSLKASLGSARLQG